MPPGAVKINENPLGPCPEAAEAIHKIVQSGGRYVQPYAGSSAPLHRAVLAFTSPSNAHDVQGHGRRERRRRPHSRLQPESPDRARSPRADMEWLLENKPEGSVLLLDLLLLSVFDARLHIRVRCIDQPA
jgi:histidinol-phosphate aminotransferase